MRRREVLRLAGATVVAGTGTVGVGAASEDDLDPRPSAAGEETLPSDDVPTIQTGAIPIQPSTLPTGRWIRHYDTWLGGQSLPRLLDLTVQTFEIDGETFVLDSTADWRIERQREGDQVGYVAIFEYATPPQQPGTSYTMTWDFEWKPEAPEERSDIDEIFPISNEIQVVPGGGGHGNSRPG